MRFVLGGAIAIVIASLAPSAIAAEGAALNGAALSGVWIVPFLGIVLSIALVPLTAPNFWRHHFGKTAAFWALAFVLPFAAQFGVTLALHEVVHTLLTEYLPFIILLFALFTVAGGIHVGGNLHGTPALNVGFLGFGAALASVMGTTGAAMLLIRPLLRANDCRRHRTHVVVFFIFLVANIGGALTPLGDPPLFLGFLKGVDFFWTTKAMFRPTVTATLALLVVFYAIDRWFYRKPDEILPSSLDPTPDKPLRITGKLNFVWLAAILGSVLLSGTWKPDLELQIFGTPIELQNAVRDVSLLAIAWASWRYTPRSVRRANQFDWAPIAEVAKLFAGIFLTIVPAVAILRAGHEGVMAPVLALVSDAAGKPNDMLYFWATGVLSSFLDNAPTYLVFFNLAGGDAALLTGSMATTLAAISAGAVFMGANTYIGNAPNFMVKSIAQSRGVPMPSFLGYMGWSMSILLPVFLLITLLFFV